MFSFLILVCALEILTFFPKSPLLMLGWVKYGRLYKKKIFQFFLFGKNPGRNNSFTLKKNKN